jgi:molybdenum cofactor synthesis domain-containing protein
MASVAVLIVGDEILKGEIDDENAPYLLRELREAGVPVERIVTVPDRRELIVEELQRLRALADAVVVSGGLGPTHDDVTRMAVADALDRDLVVHPEAEARVRGFYAERVTDAELAMACMPRGARLVDGLKTGTFGFEVEGVYALPGVPFLFRDIVDALKASFAEAPLHRCVLETRRREGQIAPCLAAAQERSPDVEIGSYPIYEEAGTWRVRVVLRCADPERLAQVAREVESGIQDRV